MPKMLRGSGSGPRTRFSPLTGGRPSRIRRSRNVQLASAFAQPEVSPAGQALALMKLLVEGPRPVDSGGTRMAKAERPEGSKPDSFRRFEDLARRLFSVPKKEIDEKAKEREAEKDQRPKRA